MFQTTDSHNSRSDTFINHHKVQQQIKHSRIWQIVGFHNVTITLRNTYNKIQIIIPLPYTDIGPGSSVGIASGYGLDGPGSNPSGGRIFAPVQTGPGAHPASCTMGTGSFPGVKSGRGVTLTPHPLLVPLVMKG